MAICEQNYADSVCKVICNQIIWKDILSVWRHSCVYLHGHWPWMTRLMLNSAGLKRQLFDQNLSSGVHSRELLAEGNLSFQMVDLLKFFFFSFFFSRSSVPVYLFPCLSLTSAELQKAIVIPTVRFY